MQNTKQNHGDSDHDERSETLATDVAWDSTDKPTDDAMMSERHAKQFKADGTPLSEEDWEREEELDDKLPDHLSQKLDSLEALAEDELNEDEDDENE